MDKNATIKLSSGYEIPIIGLGTWQNTGDSCKETIIKAIELGYRHIDTADRYGNHEEIGEAINDSGLNREELFITTKIWPSDLDYDSVIEKADNFLKQLGTEYIDLLLIHWPNKNADLNETFRAFRKLKDEGKVKSFGVSNFTINHIRDTLPIAEENNVPITMNQVEFHPGLFQKELLDFCKMKGIALTAYSPLARGNLSDSETLETIAEAKGKSVSQISLRWMIQKDIIVIPKASSENHLKDNLDIFDFELTKNEEESIDELGSDLRLIVPSFSDFDY